MLKITSSIVKTKNFNRIRYLYEAQTKKCLRFKIAELKLVQRLFLNTTLLNCVQLTLK